MRNILTAIAISVLLTGSAQAVNWGKYMNDNLSELNLENGAMGDGLAHFVSDIDSDVDIATSKYWVLCSTQVASTSTIHIRVRVSSSLNGTLYIYENSTASSNGTELDILNSDRRIANGTSLRFFKDSVITSSGTLLMSRVMGNDGTAPQGGGDEGALAEGNAFILDYKNYLFMFTSKTDNNRVSIRIRTFQHSR